jgi:hypothetical protein
VPDHGLSLFVEDSVVVANSLTDSKNALVDSLHFEVLSVPADKN